MKIELTAAEVSTLQDFLQSHIDTFEPESADEHADMINAANILGKLNDEPSAMQSVNVDLDKSLYYRNQI